MKNLFFLICLLSTISMYSQNSDSVSTNDCFIECHYNPLFFSNIPKDGIRFQNISVSVKQLYSISEHYKMGVIGTFAEFENYKITFDSDVRDMVVSSDAMQIQVLKHGFSLANRLLFCENWYADIDLTAKFQSMYKKKYIDYSPYNKYSLGNYKSQGNPSAYLDLAVGYKFAEIQLSAKLYDANWLAPFYCGIGLQFRL